VKALDLQSECYQPTGSISADGIKNQLGRPKLDRLTLLARESVQNSWDARLADKGVRFGMAGWNLLDPQRAWLLETLFKKSPPHGLELRALLESEEQAAVLAVYDRGTKGLCGPTRADKISSGGPSNFVDLLRNVGQPPTAFLGGGTYGFGKTALFLASRARTIIAHTQVSLGKRYEQRLMGAALGSQYAHKGGIGRGGRRYTGRHWWGRKDGNVVEPLTGREAVDAAKAIGMPTFEKEESGTTILMLLPDFEGRTPEEALRFIGEAILRTYWPKMVDATRGTGSMMFQLSWNGGRIPMPRPQDVPPLSAYVKAFANLQAKLANKPLPHAGGWLQPIESQRPARTLGTLSLIKFPPEPRLVSASNEDDQGPFQEKSHHTALMRGPHFVVNYLEGPTMPYELAEYAGVFLTNSDSEEAYARSEPPTHDAWIPDMLDGTAKRLVNIGLRKIKEGMQQFAGVSVPEKVAGQTVPLGAFSDLLGGLIPGELGTGARGASDTSGRSYNARSNGADGATKSDGVQSNARVSRTSRVRILETGEPQIVVGTKVPVFKVLFDVEPDERTEPLVVSAVTNVQLEDGSIEAEPPLGAERPVILFWCNKTGKVISRTSSLELRPTDHGPWIVAITMPSDAVVAVELDLEPSK
jgi:hypothetical protein